MRDDESTDYEEKIDRQPGVADCQSEMMDHYQNSGHASHAV
jgi:hypothetical protein